MKLKVVMTMVAAGAAVLLASCGGGGGGGGGSSPDATLQVSGTTATGMALASAAVEVKCASGTGTATTSESGTYTIAIPQGALPCAVQVTGSGASSSIVLHSVVEAGSTDSGTAITSAKANVTPLTELVVAQLAAALPSDFFANFGSGSAGAVTQDKLAAAATAVTAALKDAGIDLGGIDPLKADLVAATATASGNNYDQLLDALAQKVSADALPLLVTQVATAAASGASTGLTDAMAAVQGGGLAGCPYVLSGNFRAIDYLGRTTLRPINFAAKTFGAGDGVNQMDIVAQDTTNPCIFTATLTQNGQTGEWQVAFGPGGVGIYRARISAPTASVGITGVIFPVQSHTYADVGGTWDFLQTGWEPNAGVQNQRGQVTLAADHTASSCDYDTAAGWACVPENSGMSVTERSDGGIDIAAGQSTPVTAYAYRGPSGALMLFGTSNPGGSTDLAVEQSSLFLVRLAPWVPKAVGTVTRSSQTLVLFSSPTSLSRTTNAVSSDEVTTIAVDTATGTVQRQTQSDGRVDTWHMNQPISGLSTRDPNTKVSKAYQMAVPGTSLILTTNADGASGRSLAYSVSRP